MYLEFGKWTLEKLRHYRIYLRIAEVICEKQKWNVFIVDTHAGTGKIKIRGTSKICDGSALINAKTRYPCYLIEMDRRKASWLRFHVRSYANAKVLTGDWNEMIKQVLSDIVKFPVQFHLGIFFIDPSGYKSLHFESIRLISSLGCLTDLWITLNSHAILRALSSVVSGNDNCLSSLSQCFGLTEEAIYELGKEISKSCDSRKKYTLLESRYLDQLESLGYFTCGKRINDGSQNKYLQIFASKSKRIVEKVLDRVFGQNSKLVHLRSEDPRILDPIESFRRNGQLRFQNKDPNKLEIF